MAKINRVAIKVLAVLERVHVVHLHVENLKAALVQKDVASHKVVVNHMEVAMAKVDVEVVAVDIAVKAVSLLHANQMAITKEVPIRRSKRSSRRRQFLGMNRASK